MSDTAAGQSSERVPDFIPGWFRRRGPDQVREAVRVEQDAAHFPVHFLRGDEFVGPAQPHGALGVSIGRRGSSMSLAVPPGYWLVRDDDGELRNWRAEDFREQFARLDTREWEPPTVREQPKSIGKVAPSDEHADAIDGWRGTPPAEGTRRALILGCLDGSEVHLTGGSGGYLTHRSALAHADAIEAALLDCQIAAEARVHGGPMVDNPHLPPEYKQRIVEGAVAAVGEEPDRPDAEIVDSDGHTLGGLEVVIGAQDGVPYVSLADLEHVFANLYEDITDRQARKQRSEATLTGTMQARDGESPTADVEPVDEFDVQREATRALYDRITDGPMPNPSELARVIAILGGPVGVGR